MDWVTYAKLAPIIAYPGWECVIKENKFLLKMLAELRQKGAKVCFDKKKRALEFEALLYLHSASLAVPLSKEWVRIYTYLFRKYIPAGKGLFSEPIVLSEYEMKLLRELREWIFKQQLKHIKIKKNKEKGQRKRTRTAKNKNQLKKK